MKKIIIAFGACGMLFASCKEKAPFIKLDNSNFTDTSYSLSTIPAAEPHNVLVEEFTGASCTNCPAAHETLDALEAANHGRLNVIGLYIYNVVQTQPPHGAKYDFRDSTSSTISNEVYGGVNQLPNGGIDRSLVNGNLQVAQGNWSATINDRLKNPTPINLKIESHFNSISGDNTIIASVIYTQDVSTHQNLSIAIVEDGIVDYQEYPYFHPVFPDGLDTSYIFTNVFRQMVTSPPFGDPILGNLATKKAGQALVRTFTYRLSSKILNADKCRIIAFVNNTDGTDRQIIQSCQAKLKS